MAVDSLPEKFFLLERSEILEDRNWLCYEQMVIREVLVKKALSYYPTICSLHIAYIRTEFLCRAIGLAQGQVNAHHGQRVSPID